MGEEFRREVHRAPPHRTIEHAHIEHKRLEATIRVHYPAGHGEVLLRSSDDWSRDLVMHHDGATHTATIALSAPAEIKPILRAPAGVHWSLSSNTVVAPGQTIDIQPYFDRGNGVVHHERFYSHALGNERDVWIYLPPGFQKGGDHPLVLMHDGQETVLAKEHGGWGAPDVLNKLSQKGLSPVVVMIAHMGKDRIREYGPTDWDTGIGQGGDADKYVKFLTDELLPELQKHLAVGHDANKTVIAGSSMGGLVSLHAGMSRPDVFGNVVAMSPSTQWDGDWAFRQIRSEGPRRIYVDSGTRTSVSNEGSGDNRALTQKYANTLRAAGYHDGKLRHVVGEGHAHDKPSWNARLYDALDFALSGH